MWAWSVVEVVVYALVPLGLVALVVTLLPLRNATVTRVAALVSRVAGWTLVALTSAVVLVDLHNILYVVPNGPGTGVDYMMIPPGLAVGLASVLVARHRRRRVTVG